MIERKIENTRYFMQKCEKTDVAQNPVSGVLESTALELGKSGTRIHEQMFPLPLHS